MTTDLIGVRDSTASPGTMEYYNKSTDVGFSTPQELSNFYNTLYGGNTTAENVFQAIPVSSLQSEQAITVPTQTPQADALAPAAASAKETSKSLEQYIAELTPPQTETSKQYDALSAQISELLPSLTGRGQEQLKAEEQSGLPQMKTQLAQINSQLLQKVAEATKLDASYEQLIANLENPANAQQQGIPMSAIIGQQAQARKMQLAERNAKAADIGLLQAYALGLQGQVQAAQAAVDRAIDLKYQDRESTLNLKMQQLSLLEGKLNREEQRIAEAWKLKYADEQARIAQEKENAKTVQNIAIEAARFGATPETLKAIQNAKTPADAITLAGYTLGAEFRQKMAQQEFDNKMQMAQMAISKANLAVSQGNLSLSRERLAFEKTKEAFDQAVKLAGTDGKVTRDANGNLVAVPTATPIMQQALSKASIDLTSSLLTDKGLNSSVGPNYLARFSVVNALTGAKSNFIAGVEQLRSQLNLQSLIDAKSRGATFGALSDNELQMLASAATKIGTWATKDKNGNITGYNVNEKSFRAELDKINNFAKLDYILKGGNPNDVGVKKEPDGTFSTMNSDGSITNLGN